ncbi:MAG: asparagine synthase-related protein, partial [Gemmatimonadales bacterium]
YWRWDRIAPSTRPEPDLVRAAYDRFAEAIDIRLRGDRTVTAFLSGGLDSRAVIGLLRDRGVAVHTFNFSVPDTQDRVFARQFAHAAGTVHHEAAMEAEVELRFSTMLSQHLATLSRSTGLAPDRPKVAWSGEGGSMGAGHIYQTKAMVDFLRAGARDAAINAYLDQQKAFVLNRLLQPGVSAALADVPRRGMAEEFDDIRSPDRGRGIYLFLLLNDQRRHLATHFENLDLDRLELQTPFYDSDFLQAMIEAPIDLCLGHRFYMKWLSHFPPTVTAVPWQFYPGHIPCPLPIPKGLHYQWQGRALAAFAEPRRRELLRDARAMLSAPDFPDDTLRKHTIRLAAWISRAALGNYDYVLHHASIYYRYWSRARGRWTMSSAASG